MNRDFYRRISGILLAMLLLIGIAAAEPVAKIKYVYLDYSGEYTGQADTNGVPFGFGVFESATLEDGEFWHYIGQWEDGLPEGEGAIYYDNGNIKRGTFSKGILTEGYLFASAGLAVTPVQTERSLPVDEEVLYIGNKNSMKFHYPSCKSVSQMKEKNKVEFYSREEAIQRNFTPCGECNP